MIIVPSNVAAKNLVTIKSSSTFNDLNSSRSLPPHQAGDLLLMCFYPGYSGSNYITPTAPTAGGAVPSWNYSTYIAQYYGNIGLAWTFATSSSTETGAWSVGYFYYCYALVLTGAMAVNPIGTNKFTKSIPNYPNANAPDPSSGSFTPTNASGTSLFLYMSAGSGNYFTTGVPSDQTLINEFGGNWWSRLSSLNSRTSTAWTGHGTIGNVANKSTSWNVLGFEVVGQ